MNPIQEGYIPLSKARDYMELPGIYEIVCQPKGRVYVGQSIGCAKRSYEHFSMLKNGNHPNRAMQFDYDTLRDPNAFYFKVIIPFDAPDEKALLRAEAKEIERRHKHGVILYNKLDIREIDPNAPARVRQEAKKPVQQQQEEEPKKERVDYRNLPYHQRPEYNPPIYEGECIDCGFVGVEKDKLFFCDDKQLRCPPCVDERSKNIQAFLRSERERREQQREEGVRTTSGRRMRWQMGSNTAENDLTSAMAVYIRKYGQFPTEAYFNPECILPGRDDIKIQPHRFIPIGYIDFPIPVFEK